MAITSKIKNIIAIIKIFFCNICDLFINKYISYCKYKTDTAKTVWYPTKQI